MQRQINHHLTDEILMGYAAGTLPEAFNLMVAAHVSLCDECRARLESYEALGGEVLEMAGDNHSAMAPGSLQATMALIAGGPIEPAVRPVRASGGILPGPLQDYVGTDLNDVSWRGIGMGVRQAILKTDGDATARLLYIPAGAAMPDHGHQGLEMTMVLQGAFQDEDDYFGPGDVEVATSDTHHTPIADIHEDCICLAVTDAPLHFDGIIHKVAQRWARI
ncbi:MAG: ChrR family anti-sigma-E factor [Pseudomonadota bacterium]